VERVETLGASDDARGGRAGVGAEGPDRDVDRLIVAASERAAEIVDDGPPRLMAYIFGNGFNAIGDNSRSQGCGLGHSVQFMRSRSAV
jgi:hypothetical protein